MAASGFRFRLAFAKVMYQMAGNNVHDTTQEDYPQSLCGCYQRSTLY